MARGSLVWWNGKITPAEACKISPFTHGLHYGFGAFEGIRAYKQKKGGGAIFRLAEHLERLEDSSQILGLKLPYSRDVLTRACIETCKANKLDECYIRPLLFTADGPLGVDPGTDPPIDVGILVWEWGHYLGDDGVKKGAKMVMSSFSRPHVNSSMTKGKITGGYVTGVLAKREAIRRGYQEAVLLDTEGYVAEASGANIFIVKDGVVKTTPKTCILDGITRRTIITHLRGQKVEVQEQRFTREEVWCADEAFLTGTAAEITPIRELDDRPIGRGDKAGKPGPLVTRLQRDFYEITRGDLPEWGRNWLTPIQ